MMVSTGGGDDGVADLQSLLYVMTFINDRLLDADDAA
jgi:hypothetical protein